MDDRNSKHDICLITGESKRTFKSELEAEIVSSDEIMFLVSFIRKSGVESILSPLHDFTERGGRLKVLTTTYMGVTDPEAIQTLSNLKNTEIKVSYDTGHTRLHAKAYIFLRGNRGSTAFIGSSNLSEAAIVYGMEWNVKLNDKETRVLLDKAVEVFDYYWNSNMFIPLGIDKFYTAVSAERERGMLRKEQLSGDPPIESPFSE